MFRLFKKVIKFLIIFVIVSNVFSYGVMYTAGYFITRNVEKELGKDIDLATEKEIDVILDEKAHDVAEKIALVIFRPFADKEKIKECMR